MKQVRRFVVLFEGRTGSTHLGDLLRSHPRLRMRSEGLSGLKRAGAGAPEQAAWLRETFSAPRGPLIKVVGFKTKLRDVLDPAEVSALLREYDAHIIHMSRRNVVKTIVSSINSERLYEQIRDWNMMKGTDRPPPLEVDVDDFEVRLERRERLEAELQGFIREVALPTYEVVYEDLLARQRAMVSDLYRWLGLRPVPLKRSRWVKVTSDDLRRAVANYGELRARLAGTRYEAMLE